MLFPRFPTLNLSAQKRDPHATTYPLRVLMAGFVPDYNTAAVILALPFYNIISNCCFLTDLMSHRTVVITIFYFFFA